MEMKEDGHKFKPLKIEKDGKKVHACQECGALKIGDDTIVVSKDYVDLAPLTSDPSLAEGRVWFRGDNDETRWSPDGSIVEIWGTAGVGAPGLTSIKGFTYLATGTPTDSWYFTADPNKDVWIRQYPTNACTIPSYQYYGTYLHWTADSTFLSPIGSAASVYGDGEVMSVTQTPDGTKTQGWDWKPYMKDYHMHCWDGQYWWAMDNDAQTIYKFDENWNPITSFYNSGIRTGMAWDGQYLLAGGGGAAYGIYKFKPDGTFVEQLVPNIPRAGVAGVSWDGQYLYHSPRAFAGGGWVYKWKPDGTIVNSNQTWPGVDINSLAYDGNYLWTAADDQNYVYVIKASDLSPVSALGWNEPGYAHGTAWDGKYLTVGHRGPPTVTGPGYIYQYGASGGFDLNYNISPV